MDVFRQRPASKPKLEIKRRCHRCRGSGRETCQICNGTGQTLTGRDIYGKMQFTTCSGCFGNRAKRCTVCNGEGFVL